MNGAFTKIDEVLKIIIIIELYKSRRDKVYLVLQHRTLYKKATEAPTVLTEALQHALTGKVMLVKLFK